MNDLLVILVTLSVLSIYYYGLRALIVLLISVITCQVTDIICLKAVKVKENVNNFTSTAVTGFIIALMMPASVVYHFIVITCVFAIIIGKHAFGGHKREIFSSAAAAFLFVSLCFPANLLIYPKPFDKLPTSSSVSLETLFNASTKSLDSANDIMDLLIGKVYGPMGTGFIIILAVCALILILRRSVSAISFFTQIIIISVFSFFYLGRDLLSLVNLLCGGMLIFGILFLSCDFRTIPKTKLSRFIYGAVVAILFLIFEFYSKTENAIIYAVIISAPIGIELDKRALSFADILDKNNSGLAARFKRRFIKPVKSINETLQILERSGDIEQSNKDRNN